MQSTYTCKLDVVEDLAIDLLLGILIIDEYVQEILPVDRKLVPWQVLLVEALVLS